MTGTKNASRGTVLTLPAAGAQDPLGHDAVTRGAIARALAGLKGYAFGGDYEAGRRYPGPLYFVPGDTLVGRDWARRLSIRSEDDLFGGVVPHGFVATKSITHPLLDGGRAPRGWAEDFARRVERCVLRGFAAFDPGDARRAGARLLEAGPVRVKRSRGIAGRGQWTVRDRAELSDAIDAIDAAEIADCGLVVEENLDEVTTYSVGQVRAAGIVASYWGTQRLTRDNRGEEIYGGSELEVVRGGFDALDAWGPPADVRRAIGYARVYDEAADACFAGFRASRRNYDIAQGLDAAGEAKAGVLEQSWRIGGASGAEVAALACLQRDPALRAVRVATIEMHGEDVVVPADATVLFRGVDPKLGSLAKYVVAERP